MKNAMTFEKAAVYAVEQASALTRLQHERDTLIAQKRFAEAIGVNRAMRSINRLDVHIIPQTEWRETRK